MMPKSKVLHEKLSADQRGFSYAEVLLSVILLAILLVPAMQALNSAIAGGSSNVAARHSELAKQDRRGIKQAL